MGQSIGEGETRDYKIISDNIEYLIRLYIVSDNLFIQAFEEKESSFSYYKTKLDLDTALNLFHIFNKEFTKISQVLLLLDSTFKEKKVTIKLKNKRYIDLYLYMKLESEEKQYPLRLKYINLEEKLDSGFKEKPLNLKELESIIDTNKDSYNENGTDTFEIFTSLKNKNVYLSSLNKDNNQIDIINLINKKKITSLKGHSSSIKSIKYFFSKNNEYLVSVDFESNIIIWEAHYNFDKIHKIQTNYSQGSIVNCLLLFNLFNNDYIITSTDVKSNFQDSLTKIYTFEDGKFLKFINNTNNDEILYLLPWYNKENNEYYIIQLCNQKITINNILKDEATYYLIMDKESNHFNGFIFTKNNIDYLCNTSEQGLITFWNLFNKTITSIIQTDIGNICSFIFWSKRYLIISTNNDGLEILDLKETKISRINGKAPICIKKIFHPIYGESLLTSYKYSNNIKLWTKILDSYYN